MGYGFRNLSDLRFCSSSLRQSPIRSWRSPGKCGATPCSVQRWVPGELRSSHVPVRRLRQLLSTLREGCSRVLFLGGASLRKSNRSLLLSTHYLRRLLLLLLRPWGVPSPILQSINFRFLYIPKSVRRLYQPREAVPHYPFSKAMYAVLSHVFFLSCLFSGSIGVVIALRDVVLSESRPWLF